MLGWVSAARIVRSLAMRSDSVALQWPRGSFSATGRLIIPSMRSASHTMPMPPLPSSLNKRYGPTVWPLTSEDEGSLSPRALESAE